MTQQAARKEYNTFVKGIITEAGPLTYPENASIDEENCVLHRDGSRQRRLGMDFEDDYVLRNVTVLSDDAIACFRWFNAANDVDNQLAVVQAGQKLLIFNAAASSISADYITTIDLSPDVTGKEVLGTACGMGYFFVTGGITTPFYLSYNPATNTVTKTTYTIKIRDIFGVDDSLDVDENPVALSTAHNYNLLNQGWTAAHIATYGGAGTYPSNAQQWFVGKDSNDDFQVALLKKQDFGTTPAPRGRFVIDAFQRSTSRTAATGLAVAADLETGYPTVVGFAFQRVWYAGCTSKYNGASEFNPNCTGFVFYSRTLRSAVDFGQCYADADPTSEIDSTLVDTDGGFINIPESGRIHKLIQKGDAILVFAEQGIWEIRGDEGGFRATAQQVSKLSEFGVLSGTSVVDAEETIVYWNRGGIYLLSPDEATGRLSSKSISENTIQTLFNEINKAGKKHAVGSFDPINRRISWMYNDTEGYTGETFRNSYNRELVLDIVLQAFYKNSISTHEDPSPYIAGYLETPDFLLREEGIRTRGDSITKYLVVQFVDPATNLASVSFAYYRDPTFRDWKSLDDEGTSYSSYLITGWETMGDTMRNKTAQKLVTHFKRTELNAVDNGEGQAVPDNPSSCLMQTRWDWSDSGTSGKWSEEFQVYRPRPYVLTIGEPIDYGYDVITNKNTIPGKGRALSIKFRSDGDNDFLLYGWAIKFTGQQSV
jgi:hypothetical protein